MLAPSAGMELPPPSLCGLMLVLVKSLVAKAVGSASLAAWATPNAPTTSTATAVNNSSAAHRRLQIPRKFYAKGRPGVARSPSAVL
jgi:hypothetical protein